MRTLIFLLFLTVSVLAQEIIDISVKGISNKQNDGAQQDRLEAIMDAKRQACEKAGMTIESKTKVENFEVVFDTIAVENAETEIPSIMKEVMTIVRRGSSFIVVRLF